MPHPSDGQIVQHMRQVNIAEIGSNTREFREIGDLVFEADHEEKKAAEKVALAKRTTFQYHFTKLLSQVTLSHLDIIACWALGTGH